MSNRFFFDGPLGLGGVSLEGPEAHHLSAVRRFVAGDEVSLFNGDGREYPARVLEVSKKRVSLLVTGIETAVRELAFSLHIAAALPKGDRGDFLIEKLTELGVTDFTPLITERSVVKAGDAKTEKQRRAVIEASKQCGRNVLMRVHEPARWLEWCAKQTVPRYLAHPTSDAAAGLIPGPAIVAVGAEGGFSANEVGAAIEAGWRPVSLGARILRVETAAIVAAARFGAETVAGRDASASRPAG